MTPLLLAAAYVIARRQQRSTLLKHEKDATKLVRAQIKSAVDEYLHRVRRHLERQVLSQLGRYEALLDEWRRERQDEVPLTREDSTEDTRSDAGTERSRLLGEIAALKLESSRWQSAIEQLTARLDALRSTD